MNSCSNCGRQLKDTDLTCPYCTTDLNETPEQYKYVKDTVPEEETEHNSVSGLLSVLGSIIWVMTLVIAVIVVALRGVQNEDAGTGIITELPTIFFIGLGGTISGGLLKGFAELLDKVDDINRKLSKK